MLCQVPGSLKHPPDDSKNGDLCYLSSGISCIHLPRTGRERALTWLKYPVPVDLMRFETLKMCFSLKLTGVLSEFSNEPNCVHQILDPAENWGGVGGRLH